MVINKTRALAVKTHAVFPESIIKPPDEFIPLLYYGKDNAKTVNHT